MKHLNPLIIALFLFIGCSAEEEKGAVSPVIISEVNIPTSVKVNETAPIHVGAYATNGCWSDLRINLDKLQEKHYQITATGFHDGGSICPAVIIEADTTFHLTFNTTGKYYFQSNKEPLEIKYDSLEVVN